MNAISHQQCKWKDLDHCHITHDFFGGVGTQLDHHAKNDIMAEFPEGNKKFSKKGVMSRKLAIPDTSTNDVSQRRLSDKSNILLTTFEPS